MINYDTLFRYDDVDISFIKAEDITDIIRMFDSEKFCRYLYFAPAPEKIYRDYFEPLVDETKISLEKGDIPDFPVFTVRDAGSKEFLGQCSLTPVPFLEQIYEVSFQFKEEAWGRGMGTLSCQFIKFFAFSYLNARRLNADCYGRNGGSQKVLLNSGFVSEGVRRNFYSTEYGFDDKLLFGLLREDLPDEELKEAGLRFKQIG